MEVLVRCEPSGVTRLLATSKALTNIANENETTIYRKLYHNLLVKGAVGAHVIHSPVWKKGKALISYPLSAPLPAAVIYSWKVLHSSLSISGCYRMYYGELTTFLCSHGSFSTNILLCTRLEHRLDRFICRRSSDPASSAGSRLKRPSFSMLSSSN